MPVAEAIGGFFAIHASAQPCHCLSRHIGSLMDAPLNSSGEFGKQTQPFVPAFNCRGLPVGVAGQSMIVAPFAISAGAALIAFAIFWASVILDAPDIAMPPIFAGPAGSGFLAC